MKKLLLLCVVFSLTVLFVLLLFTNGSRPSSKDGLFQVSKFWKERILGSCPETPPGLIGSLRVGFGWNLTWDDVRKTRSSLSLQEGGRYKPPNCISNHKVGDSSIYVYAMFYMQHLCNTFIFYLGLLHVLGSYFIKF